MSISEAMQQHFAAARTRIFLMGFFDFEVGPSHLHTDLGIIEWEGQEWAGVGDLASVSDIQEDEEMSPTRLVAALNGLSRELVVQARASRFQDRDYKIWVAARDLITGALVPSPQMLTQGIMEAMTLPAGIGPAEISMHLTDERFRWERSPQIFFSHASQTSRHPADKFFADFADADRIIVTWGPSAKQGAPSQAQIAPRFR